jgi:hypothetical protein
MAIQFIINPGCSGNMCEHVVVILEIRILADLETLKRNLGLQIRVILGNLLLICVDPHPCFVSISKSQIVQSLWWLALLGDK